MRASYCQVLLCATALIIVSLGADARYWRHYGYWFGSRSNGDEPRAEKPSLNELGVTAAQGREGLKELLAIVADERDERLPISARISLVVLAA